jgi:hypothetical protein
MLNKLYTKLSTAVDNFDYFKIIHSSFLIISKHRVLFKELSTKNIYFTININKQSQESMIVYVYDFE